MCSTIDMRKFDWDRESRQLMSSASALGWEPGKPGIDPFSDSRWPYAFNIRSHHTGVVEQFHQSESLMSPEGTCYGIVYTPANMSLRVSVTVFDS